MDYKTTENYLHVQKMTKTPVALHILISERRATFLGVAKPFARTTEIKNNKKNCRVAKSLTLNFLG